MWIFFFVFVRVRLIMKENEKSYNYQLMNLSNQLLLSIMVVQDTESKQLSIQVRVSDIFQNML